MKKGFTLLELLIVIGILAILSAVTVLVLNPAELLRQARDAQRLNDLKAINNALGIYLGSASSPSLGESANLYSHQQPPGTWSGCATSGTVSSSTSRVVTAGWIPVNFGAISGGSPLAVLPVDPSNTGGGNGLLYTYKTDGSTAWELNANMESTRYAQGGANSAEDTDGGNCATLYELGNDPGLDL